MPNQPNGPNGPNEVENVDTNRDVPGDLPLTPMSLGSTTSNHTGSWKYLEPYFEEWTAPCAASCPVRNDISTLMRLAEDGEFEAASLYLLEHNPFPATLGRLCSHPCEQPCNRKAAGGAVRIQSVERFVGDYAIAHDLIRPTASATNLSVAVVGAGPAGLSAAYFLRLLGHEVTVFEKTDHIGGQLIWRTPGFRAPMDVLGQELDRLYAMGVRFELRQIFGRGLELSDLREDYDAVVLAFGRSQPLSLDLHGSDHPAVLPGAAFLERIRRGELVPMGRHVLVFGGNRLALDCARTLRRLDKEVRVVFPGRRSELAAPKADVADALQEEIPIELHLRPVRMMFEETKLVGVACVRTNGDQKEVPLRADAVIVALGDELASDVIDSLDESLEANGSIPTVQFKTTLSGVYACGECASPTPPGADPVAVAVALGREAASRIHEDLAGAPVELDPLRRRHLSSQVAKFKDFARAYLGSPEPVPLIVRCPEERVQYLADYVDALDEGEVVTEAGRCIKCGTCILCDNCRLFCPDVAITWKADGSGYEILSDYCKGCGVCVEECPRGAIHLRTVEYHPKEAARSGDPS